MVKTTEIFINTQSDTTKPQNKTASSTSATINVWTKYAEGKTHFIKNDTIMKFEFYDKNKNLIRNDEMKIEPIKQDLSEPLFSLKTGTTPKNLFTLKEIKTKDYKNNTTFVSEKIKPNSNYQETFTTLDNTSIERAFSSNENGDSNYRLKISDKTEKILFNINREYKTISKSEAISKVDGREYHIKKTNEKIYVTHKEGKTKIDLNKLLPKNNSSLIERENLKNIIKQLPGDILLQLKREASEIDYLKNNGFFFSSNDKILTDERYTSILHELGHAIDIRPDQEKKNLSKYVNDKELNKIFMNERAFFKKIMPDEVEKINEAYCLDSDDKDLVQTGLEEIIADSYFIINSGCNYKSMVDKENDKITNLRQHFLLQYFPKTIAYIGNRFTEYKQIINPEKPRTLKEINN